MNEQRSVPILIATLLAGALMSVGVSPAGARGAGDASPTPDQSSSSCPRGTKAAVIGGKFKCLRVGQRCKARYQSSYRRSGFICMNGRLHKRTVAPPQPPAPEPTPPPAPAPPPAEVGHYKGQTSQLETFEFNVVSGGTYVTNIVTGQINEGCTPPGHLYGGNYRSGSALIPISADGSFRIDFDYTGTVGSSPSTGHFTIAGHLNGATAAGTLSDSTNFSEDGVGYSCGSGLQTWTASRTS